MRPQTLTHLEQRAKETGRSQTELVSRSDRELFEWMAEERRAMVTNNLPDYIVLFTQTSAAGGDHYGLLLTDDGSRPRRREAIGTFVHPSTNSWNQLRWLPSQH